MGVRSKRRSATQSSATTSRASLRPRTVPRSPSTDAHDHPRGHTSTHARGRVARQARRSEARRAARRSRCRRRRRRAARPAEDRRSACPSACRPSAGSGRSAGPATSGRLPSGVSATSSFARDGDDEAAERRPRRFAVAAEQAASSRPARPPRRPQSAVTSNRPGAGNEKSAGCAFSTPTTSRISSSTARPGGLSSPATTTSASGDRRDRLPRAAPRLRLALGERCAHDGQRPLARLVLVRELDPLQLALHTVSFRESSPRRRRELTVPRGRPSSSAISPGVYSSR